MSLVSPLFCLCFWVSLLLVLPFSSPLLGLRGFWTARPLVPKDVAARDAHRLATKEKKKKKDEEKKLARKKMLARDSLEKHRRAQARDGLLLEAPPSTKEEEDDDNDEGMEVCMGFSPKARLGSTSSSEGPSGGAVPPVQGSEASLSRTRALVEPASVSASVEEAEAVEGKVGHLPEEAIGALAGTQARSPQRPPAAGNMKEGPVTPPHAVVPGS